MVVDEGVVEMVDEAEESLAVLWGGLFLRSHCALSRMTIGNIVPSAETSFIRLRPFQSAAQSLGSCSSSGRRLETKSLTDCCTAGKNLS